MYEDLSKRELEVLFFMKSYIAKNGFAPAIRDILAGTTIKSTSTVHSNMEKLELKNYIRKAPSTPRGYEITDPADELLEPKKRTLDIPVLGRVTAGMPILAVENITDTIPLAVDFVADRELFFLTVQGESMINAGILNGDHVLIERKQSAKDGEIVLALLDDEATIKRFFKEPQQHRYRLQPENDFMEPIYTEDVQILGKVVGVFRTIM
ncbi:MAG: transcriptional repressor LexA [Tissierellia bacterium]|nr:transcriptional repressor LexA [Tissierellia bacterium]